jgi:[ribosomal protein S5]-alanine N-acetyltransferase
MTGGVQIPVLTTERLRLRGFRAEDLPAHRAAVDDDDAVTWSHVRHPLAESLRRWAKRLDEWEQNGFGMWIVEVMATGEVIGHAGIQRLEDTDDVELGYYRGRSAWGQGYATEAARACLAYGFETVGLARIVATVRTENDASRHVLTKLGFRHEQDGVFYDAEGSLMVLDRPGLTGDYPQAYKRPMTRGLRPEVEERLQELAGDGDTRRPLDEAITSFMERSRRDEKTRELAEGILTDDREFFDMLGDR